MMGGTGVVCCGNCDACMAQEDNTGCQVVRGWKIYIVGTPSTIHASSYKVRFSTGKSRECDVAAGCPAICAHA